MVAIAMNTLVVMAEGPETRGVPWPACTGKPPTFNLISRDRNGRDVDANHRPVNPTRPWDACRAWAPTVATVPSRGTTMAMRERTFCSAMATASG